MKLFFATRHNSDLADERSLVLHNTKKVLLLGSSVEETLSPELADAIIIQERNSFKNFNYIEDLLLDPLISRYANKVFTINSDDCATGLLKGVYTSLPRFRFNPEIHAAIPYMQYPNDVVFSNIGRTIESYYLASWRGNTKSNVLRKRMIHHLEFHPGIILEKTDSWLNHDNREKTAYVTVIKNAKFSLCPAGWAPVSFRIYESMALGRCPVIIADQFVRPDGPEWDKFALFFPEKNLSGLHSYLRLHERRHTQLGEQALVAWNAYFSPEKIADYYARTLLSVIKNSYGSTLEKEVQRWQSFGVYWSNHWTIPQRIVNKAKQLIVKQLA
jgi:hypothetical protein